MRARVKKVEHGVTRIDASGEIKEININEDFLNPENETVSVCFIGRSGSGIIDFSPKEIIKISDAVKDRTNLIKNWRVVRE